MDSILERQAIRVAVALAAVSGHGKTAQIIADMRDESTHLISLCLQGSTTPHQICAWCDDISDRIGRAVARGDFDDQSVLDTVMMILRLRLIATRLARQIDDRVTKKPSNSGDVQIRELQQSVASLTENAQKVFEHIKNNPDVRGAVTIQE